MENIAADKVPADLRTASIDMIKRVRKHFGKQHMLSKLVVDFEACIEAATKVYLGKQRGLKRNKFPRGAHNCVKSDSAGQSAAKTDLATSLHTGTQGAPVGAIAAVVAGTSANSSSGSHESTKGVPAPHSIVDINDSPVKFRYR